MMDLRRKPDGANGKGAGNRRVFVKSSTRLLSVLQIRKKYFLTAGSQMGAKDLESRMNRGGERISSLAGKINKNLAENSIFAELM
jgi:hypothetical protein